MPYARVCIACLGRWKYGFDHVETIIDENYNFMIDIDHINNIISITNTLETFYEQLGESDIRRLQFPKSVFSDSDYKDISKFIDRMYKLRPFDGK